MTDQLNIVVDTREQQPWTFPEQYALTESRKLDAGDYSLVGDEDGFCIERKSLNDFVGTVTSGWERFLAEIDRMDDSCAKVVIVEGDYSQIVRGEHSHKSVTARFLLKRIAELTHLGVSVLFCSTPVMATGMALSLFKRRMEQIEDEMIGGEA